VKVIYYLNRGTYKNEEGLDMVEIHVDEIPDNSQLSRINYECHFGGNLSV
jgi:hypothetical protein